MFARLWFFGLAGALVCGAAPATLADKQLAERVGCFSCHKADRAGTGPSFQDIAARYRGYDATRDKLIEIVKHGGKGQWTPVTNGAPMPPFSPRMSDKDIEKLVDWIRSQ